MKSARLPHYGTGSGTPSIRREFRFRARQARVPVKAMLELTTHCNLRCVHCYVVDKRRPELPLERWLDLIDELADAGCFTVGLTGGEVGLREDWLDIAAAVKRRRILLTILTSGTDFSPADLERLVALRPAQVCVSLYGATAVAHDTVTRVRGSFDRAVATLRTLVAAGISCRVNSVLMKQTIDHFENIAALAESLGCSFMFDPTVAPCDDGSCGVVDLRVDAQRLRQFYLSELILPHSKEGKIARAVEPPDERVPGNCDAGFTTLFVNASGELFPCMGFPPSFGTIDGASLDSVWHSRVAEKHRAAMEKPLNDCIDCSLLSYCKGRCPRLALVEHGDLSGISERACELASMTVEMRSRLRGGLEDQAISQV